MASQPCTNAEPNVPERRLLGSLLSLYQEEQRIYGRVLALSRRQGEIVRAGGSFMKVRGILAQKRDCLDAITRLEAAQVHAREAWLAQRDRWSAESRAHLHQALQEVGAVIEEILLCEEENDRQIIEKSRSHC